jgi:hypothetical protein
MGLRVSLKRLREPDAMAMLEARGVPEACRASITEALAVIDLLDRRRGSVLARAARARRRGSVSPVIARGPALSKAGSRTLR